MNEIQNKIFAMDFELRALSDVTLYGKAERWVHGFCLKTTEEEHLERYKYASCFVNNKSVLDVASGCGFGSRYLFESGLASNVTGIDLSPDSVKYANFKYGHRDVKFITGNASQLKLYDKYDVIVSFETIEHLEDVNGFLDGVYSHLNDDGLFIVSTPVVRSTNLSPENPYHKIEWSYNDFRKLLEPRFTVKELHLQSHKVLNKKYYWSYSFIRKIFNKLLLVRHQKHEKYIQFGRKLIKVDLNYDFNSIESGYSIICLTKRLI